MQGDDSVSRYFGPHFTLLRKEGELLNVWLYSSCDNSLLGIYLTSGFFVWVSVSSKKRGSIGAVGHIKNPLPRAAFADKMRAFRLIFVHFSASFSPRLRTRSRSLQGIIRRNLPFPLLPLSLCVPTGAYSELPTEGKQGGGGDGGSCR